MANITTSEKRYNKQFAESYIVYMMVGSLFKKSICKNPNEEKHLFLHYAEMPQNKQVTQEVAILRKTHQLTLATLENLKQLYCEVSFKPDATNYVIEFSTGIEQLTATIDENGYVDLQSNFAA